MSYRLLKWVGKLKLYEYQYMCNVIVTISLKLNRLLLY